MQVLYTKNVKHTIDEFIIEQFYLNVVYCFELNMFKHKYLDHLAIHAYSFSYSN